MYTVEEKLTDLKRDGEKLIDDFKEEKRDISSLVKSEWKYLLNISAFSVWSVMVRPLWG